MTSVLSPWLAIRARVSGDATAISLPDRDLTWLELQRRALARARRLLELGVRPGDRVALLLANGLPFVEFVHAAILTGITLTPLNLRLTAAELAPQLARVRPKLLLHGGGEIAERARAAAYASLPCLGAFDSEIALAPGAHEPPRTPLPLCPSDPDLATLFTSGTSGSPKAAVLSHANFHWSALASAAHLGATPDDRWLVCMPLFHVGALSILVRALLYGNCVLLHEGFDPDAVSDALDRQRVTHVSFVATMLARLLEVRGDRPAAAELRCVLLGGGPAPGELIERAESAGFPIAATYGLTEAASQVATRPPGDAWTPSAPALRPLPGTEVRVVSDSGESCAPGAAGEILVRGPTVMRGYLDQPDETAAALSEGWLHTGDFGRLAADGSLSVLDRRSDLIVSGGENVYPAEVEAVLLQHPEIAEAGVAAVADPEYGQRPAAWVVAAAGARPTSEAVRVFCASRLAAYKRPVRIEFVHALPRTASGKLQRQRLGRLDTRDPG